MRIRWDLAMLTELEGPQVTCATCTTMLTYWWCDCGDVTTQEMPQSMLPTLQRVIANGCACVFIYREQRLPAEATRLSHFPAPQTGPRRNDHWPGNQPIASASIWRARHQTATLSALPQWRTSPLLSNTLPPLEWPRAFSLWANSNWNSNWSHHPVACDQCPRECCRVLYDYYPLDCLFSRLVWGTWTWKVYLKGLLSSIV